MTVIDDVAEQATTGEPSTSARLRRIALYSHDTQGLGHIQRNIGIASALATADPTPEMLLLSGVQEGRTLSLPANTDCLTLPSLYKQPSGTYRPRSLTMPVNDLVELRGRTLNAAVEGFDPDVLIVDKVARGMFGELELVLERIRRRPDKRLVLGLRDVLDDPVTSCHEWHQTATTEAVDEFYDAVWVYGDPRVFDPVTEYGLAGRPWRRRSATPDTWLPGPSTDGAVQAAQTLRLVTRVPMPPRRGPTDLCLVGGGQDGFSLCQAFLSASHPAGVAAVAVTGPYMDAAQRAELQRVAAATPGAHVVDFVNDSSRLVTDARSIVSMGGYNTTLELLVARRPCLIVATGTPPHRAVDPRAATG